MGLPPCGSLGDARLETGVIDMDIPFLVETFWRLLEAVPTTLKLAGLSVICGLVFAVLLVMAIQGRFRPLAWLASLYVFIFRGTPLLVQLFLIYYGLGQFRPELQAIGLWTIFRDPTSCALLALTVNTAAYGAEIVRGGLQSVPAGEVEAARAFGMSGFTLYRRIICPIALRQALPAYGNEIILMVKATSVASLVTIMEITGVAQQLISRSFRALEVFIVAGALYLVINFTLTLIIRIAERHVSPNVVSRGGTT